MAITNSFYGYIMMLFAITIVVCVESQLQTFYNAIVSKDGTGNFNTIVGAILAAPDHSVKPFFIKIKKDTYEEYIRVEKKKINIVLIGEGMDNTIITGNRSFVDGNKTYDTATVARTPMARQYNTIIEQQREIESSKSGIVLQNCTIKATPDLKKSDVTTYLEYKNRGPGAVTKGRVTWASVTTDPNIASTFTVRNFINGGSANESSQVSGALAIAEVEVLTPKMSFASKYLSANVASSIALS
uniref:Pectinesterase catalytic domain-containing protein n=1 Tax=Solanum lycopersicum TaxID=4081 RepID=A0A3Q7EGF0_SOLLC